MALIDTITAQSCVSICGTTRTISEDDFLDYLINSMSSSLSLPLSELTPLDIQSAVDTAVCAMETVQNSPVSVEQKRAILLALWLSQ